MKTQQRVVRLQGLIVAGLVIVSIIQLYHDEIRMQTDNINISFTEVSETRPLTQMMRHQQPPAEIKKVMLNDVVQGAPLVGPVRG